MILTSRLLGTALAVSLALSATSAADAVPLASGAPAQPTNGTDQGRAARAAASGRELGYRNPRLTRAPQLQVQGRLLNIADGPAGESPWYVVTSEGDAVHIDADWDGEPTPGAEFTGTVALTPRQASTYRIASGRVATPGQSRRVLADLPDDTALPVAQAMLRSAPARRVHSGARAHRVFVAFANNLGDLGETNEASLARVAAASEYWSDESDGIVSSLSVAGTASIAAPVAVADSCGLGMNSTTFATQTAAARAAFPGINATPFTADHVVLFVPEACAASFALGRADQNLSFDSGGVLIVALSPGRALATGTLIHELGHNFGMGHSGLKRGCQSVEGGTGCTTPEVYGDWYSPMGNRHPDAIVSPALPTRFRVFEGIIAPGEISEFALGSGAPASTAPIALAPRAGETGLRSVSFVNPDNGDRFYLDLRDGSDRDAQTTYASGQFRSADGYLYNRGITMEAEDTDGNYLQRSPAMTSAWSAGQVWQNESKTFSVTFGANTVALNYAGAPALTGGAATISGEVRAQRKVEAVSTGFVPAATGFTYQWKANGAPIPGATLKKFYIPVSLVGAQLSVDVTGYSTGRHPTTVSVTSLVAPAALYTTDRNVPTISGTPKVGEAVSATGGTGFLDYFGQPPAGLNVYYQWNIATTPIPGALGPTMVIPGAAASNYLTVSQVAEAPGFETASYRTAGYGPVAKGTIARSSKPRIKGKVRVGSKAKAKVNRATWDEGVRFSFRWYANGKRIRGAKGTRLRLVRGLRGKRIQVRVTGSKLGYTSTTTVSKAKRVR